MLSSEPNYTIGSASDDIAIFNAGLTEAQVKEIMENGLAAIVNVAVEPAGKLTTTWANIKQVCVLA